VVISSINALTLSPALCSLILKPRKGAPRGLLRVFEGAISATRRGYVGIVSRLARVSIIGIVLVGVVLIGLGGLSRVAPTGFIPNEDQGTFAIDIQLPDAATLARTETVAREVGAIIADTPGVKEYVTVNGFSILSGGAAANGAFLAVVLDPWAERSDPELHAEAIRPGSSGACSRSPAPRSSPSARRRSPASAAATASRCRSSRPAPARRRSLTRWSSR